MLMDIPGITSFSMSDALLLIGPPIKLSCHKKSGNHEKDSSPF